MTETTPGGRPIIDREKTAPFLIRTFLKIGTFHRLNQFEDGNLPTGDEIQIFTWRDATLREVLTTLRNTAPPSNLEYRHPLARYTFRALYADSSNRGRFAYKELGEVYSRDILGEPGTLTSPAPRLLRDEEDDGELKLREEKTLDELRFVPGDYLCVMVILPKNVTIPAASGGELTIKGVSSASGPSGPRGRGGPAAGGRDEGWGSNITPSSGSGRGTGGHWRGESNAPPPARGGRGGGRGGGDFGGRERRPPPPRRDSPPRRGGGGGGGWGDRRGDRRSDSRSRSPARRRNPRYD